MFSSTKATLGILAASAVVACSSERQSDFSRSVIGDTLVVRYGASAALANATTNPVIFGSPHSDDAAIGDVLAVAEAPGGRVYLFDRTIPALMVYDTSGTFVTRWGRAGRGPGEYSEGIAGLAVTANGDLLLHDASTQRLVVFDTVGHPKAHFTVLSSLFAERSVSIGNGGGVRIRALIGDPPNVRQWPWPIGQITLAIGGAITDSLPAPTLPDTPVGSPRPFAPVKLWDMVGDYAVVARSDRYVVHVLNSDGRVVRITRNIEAPRVSPEEEEWVRRRVPNYSVPKNKPVLKNLIIGTDSTVWIERSAEVLQSALRGLSDSEQIPERLKLDAYTVAGEALGSVEFPFAARILAASRRAVVLQRERDDGSTVVERHALSWKRY